MNRHDLLTWIVYLFMKQFINNVVFGQFRELLEEAGAL